MATISTLNYTDHDLPAPVCTKCGACDFTLAVDKTDYSPCEWDGTKFVAKYVDTQASDADDAVRFFCASCGEPRAVPEELTSDDDHDSTCPVCGADGGTTCGAVNCAY